jgi:hypothetical protein
VRSPTENMVRLINEAEIDMCHTGHGKSLAGAAMRDILKRVQGECVSLGDIPQIDNLRVAMLRAHALELLDVATDLFTVIAGRLLSTAHRLEMIEEFVLADRFRTAVDVDGVEAALTDLRDFCDNFRAHFLPELSTVLKCVQVMQRVELALTAAGEVAGAALTGRTARLLGDFFNAVRGLRITNTVEVFDVNCAAEKIIRTLRTRPPLSDMTMLESEADYSRSLAQRLSFVDLLRDVEIEFTPLDEGAETMADNHRIGDVLMDAVELIAAAGAAHIALRVLQRGDFLDIEIQTRGFLLPAAIEEKRLAVYRRTLAIGGSAIAAVDDHSLTLRLGPLR